MGEAMLKNMIVWHCRPRGSQGGSGDQHFFLQKLDGCFHFKSIQNVSLWAKSHQWEIQIIQCTLE